MRARAARAVRARTICSPCSPRSQKSQPQSLAGQPLRSPVRTTGVRESHDEPYGAWRMGEAPGMSVGPTSLLRFGPSRSSGRIAAANA